MAETYCGKTCAQCVEKKISSCPGCKFGPARQPDGDCAIALCCRGKGHQDCTTCSFNETCYTLRGKEHMPEYRSKAVEAEQIRTAALTKRATIFGRWLWVLFWLTILNAITSVLTGKPFTEANSVRFIIGCVLGAVYALACGAILIRLSFEEERYRIAGICVLASNAVGALQYVPGISGSVLWILLLSVVSVMISSYGAYQELAAHSAVVVDLDSRLAEKWPKLFKAYILASLTLLCGILFALISPFLGGLFGLVSTLGLIVVSGLKLVYLYKTAKLFRKYTLDTSCANTEI
ncbi:MAG: hypothetical protein IJA47_00420 [Oscillospiraceae bacterium]|nr:hypothetical protein [Oscillospiraceae bacterium]